MTSNASSGSMCIVMDLRKMAFVSQVNLKLHTILPTVLTVEPSARVTTLLALAAIGVKSTSCLAVASACGRPQVCTAGSVGWPP
jgi:hypothetical protein